MKTLTKTLYDVDFNLWINQTLEQLKEGNFQDIDLPNLMEELESMGKSDKREINNRLIVLMMHLLKHKYQPEKRTKSWIATINEQRRKIRLIVEDSPSLKPFLKENFDNCYQSARLDAAMETGLILETFPLDCPFSETNILTTGYLLD